MVYWSPPFCIMSDMEMAFSFANHTFSSKAPLLATSVIFADALASGRSNTGVVMGRQ